MSDDDHLTRRWMAPLAVAASVALLAGGAAVLLDRLDTSGDAGPAGATGDRWHPDLPPGTGPADVRGAVPPVPQEVQFPAAEAAGAFTPALTEVVGERACTADDVDLGLARGAGDGEVDLRLELAGGSGPCVVSRYPFQQYSLDGEPVEVLGRTPDPRPGDWPAPVLVTADRAAVLRTTWSGWCEAPPFDTVEMFLDDSSVTRLEVAGAVITCSTTDGLPERMAMTGWEPETWRLGPPADFAGLEARLVRTVDGAGGTPTWVVELTARRDLELDTCPSWQVRQGGEEAAAWRLNCAGVPHRRADGTPYLPAGEPVRFAIWVSYGDTDAALTWQLTTVDGPVTVRLTEGPEAPTGAPRLVPERDANLHLWLSNQSFDDEEVHLTVTIDGTQLVDDDFAVEGQHNFVDFHVALEPGPHEVVVVSDTVARTTRTITVPERGDRWAAALYWGGQDDSPSFDWMFQDHPIGWA